MVNNSLNSCPFAFKPSSLDSADPCASFRIGSSYVCLARLRAEYDKMRRRGSGVSFLKPGSKSTRTPPPTSLRSSGGRSTHYIRKTPVGQPRLRLRLSILTRLTRSLVAFRRVIVRCYRRSTISTLEIDFYR